MMQLQISDLLKRTKKASDEGIRSESHSFSQAETKVKNDQVILDLVYGKWQLACVAQRSDPESLLLRMLCHLPFWIISRPRVFIVHSKVEMRQATFQDNNKLHAASQQHPTVHHEGWMISGEEKVFCWFWVLWLTMVVSSVALFYKTLRTNNPQGGW
jgi:hypothetical protein